MQAIQEAAHLLVNREQRDRSPFLGTCFCYRSSATLLTAAHLIVGRALATLGVSPPVVGWSTGSLPVEAVEIHPSADIAILRIRGTSLSGFYAFHGYERILGLGEGVQAYGFPEDTHGDVVRPTPRMFVGSVQRQFRYNDGRGQYLAAEVSFPSPQGLSGGPLCRARDQTTVVGLMAANQDALTYRGGFERLDDQGRWIPTERDVTRYGIAVVLSDIADWLEAKLS
jgi:hypothetical protein